MHPASRTPTPRSCACATRARCRYSVARLTPTVAAIASMVCSFESRICRATASFSTVMTGGRPAIRPRARAAASPAMVRSRIRSRSNSARTPKRWETSCRRRLWCRPVRSTPEPDSAGFEPGDDVDQVPEEAAEPVQPSHDEGVPCSSGRGPGRSWGRASSAPESLVGDYPIAARCFQRVALQGGGVLSGRHPRATRQVPNTRTVSETLSRRFVRR